MQTQNTLIRIQHKTQGGFKQGFVDSFGRYAILPNHDEVYKFSEGLARFADCPDKDFCYLTAHFGYMDAEGKVTIKPTFRQANDFSEGFATVRSESEWGFVDRQGRFNSIRVSQGRVELCSNFNEGLVAFMVELRWGFADSVGKVIIEPTFYQVGKFSEGLCPVVVSQAKRTVDFWGYIDLTGRLILGGEYAEAMPFVNGEAEVVMYVNGVDNNFSRITEVVIDRDGNIIRKPVRVVSEKKNIGAYPKDKIVSVASPELIPVLRNGRWGFSNSKGEIEIEPKFNYALPFSEQLAGVFTATGDDALVYDEYSVVGILNDAAEEIEGKWGFIDITGKLVIRQQYDLVQPFEGGCARVYVGSKSKAIVEYDNYGARAWHCGLWGLIDKSGNYLIQPKFSEIGSYSEGIAWAFGKDVTAIDRLGKQLFVLQNADPDFQPGPFSYGLARVRLFRNNETSKWGFVNKGGRTVIDPVYDDAFDFSEGLALVKVHSRDLTGLKVGENFRGRWGYIDNTGAFVVAPRFDNAESFADGSAIVQIGSGTGRINRNGEWVEPLTDDGEHWSPSRYESWDDEGSDNWR